MVQVLVEVRDPLLRDPATEKAAPPVSGLIRLLEFVGGSTGGVVEIPRAARTDRGTVWTVTGEKTLQEQAVEVVYESKKSLFIQPTLSADVRIVTSPSRVQWRGWRFSSAPMRQKLNPKPRNPHRRKLRHEFVEERADRDGEKLRGIQSPDACTDDWWVDYVQGSQARGFSRV